MDQTYYVREFLNKPGFHSTALALGEVKAYDHHFEADLTLSDCSRQISLDFSAWTDADSDDLSNVAHKSRTLRRIVNEFLDAVDQGVKEQRKRAREASS